MKLSGTTGRDMAVSWGAGRIDVFEIGKSRSDRPETLQQMWYDRGRGGWHGWTDIGRPSGSVTLYETGVASWGPGRLDVFVLGSPQPGEFTIYHKYYDNGSWSGWEDLGGYLGGTAKIASRPAAVSMGANRIDVFVMGSDKHLYHKWWNGTEWRP